MRKILPFVLALALLMSCAAAEDVHFALRGRDYGPCKKLLGDVEIIVIFVNTPQHPWTDALREAARQEARKVLETLEKSQSSGARFSKKRAPDGQWR